MAKIKFDGLEEYERKLSALGKAGHDIAGKAIYKGAGSFFRYAANPSISGLAGRLSAPARISSAIMPAPL